jgi:GTP diphosphokinase / guanosine-3',5'-bis(diphosphate) 3'-diphosphatase
MNQIKDIIFKVLENNQSADADLVERAYVFAEKAHEGQKRLSDEPYLSHLVSVADILADMNLDAVSVAAGLLHDVLELTPVTEMNIKSNFGDEVLRIVSGVTKISALPLPSSNKVRQAENIRKMILAMADDIRVILIKLADRLHNMRTIEFHEFARRQEISQETLDIYSPIAARLGIYWIKNELDLTAFQYVQPEAYEDVKNRINKGRADRDKYVEQVHHLLKEKLTAEGLACDIFGRYKNYYSIFSKMVSQKLPFEEIYDIIAFRVIVNTIPQCYEVLGHVHSMWKPIAKKFKDYIGFPKPNMYQSLHTTVVGPSGERMEIQIRTWDMDAVAKSGIAAHWSYKEGKAEDEATTRLFGWIQNLVENQATVQDPGEFLENVRIDLFPDEVYVFTPNGEIKTLAKGATPVDFAYMIHTEVGNQCTGAKVDGRMVPIHYELKTGNIVEILTKKNQHPSKDWLNFVKTVKARSRVRQWIKTQDRARSLSLGREMCEKMFRKHRMNFNKLLKSDEMATVADMFGFKEVEDLVVSVGYGKITPLQIFHKFSPKEEPEPSPIPATKHTEGARKRKDRSGVLVKGLDDILIKFGKCCQPVPGDPITGYITHGAGVTVHRTICINALKMNPERWIDVAWSSDVTDTYPAKIEVGANDRVGLLADVAASISKAGANILSAESEVSPNQNALLSFTIVVKDKLQIEAVIAEIRRVKPVHTVRRVKT